ncbi:FecCD family ABC transporter permease [Anaerocolumna cellulosilytica]|nr:iron ABC transporter permease [Anaerocolumna cellulosilytica]MBB5197279.1 iron complex transport system permease protein [Anaerocolumna cellulosilytica]
MPVQSQTSRKGAINFTFYMLAGLILLLLLTAASISFGAAEMKLSTAWGAIFQFNTELTEHQIIRTLRLPRTIADIMVGASLAITGAIMQGTTRNPMADSGLMGISSGSTFAMAICLAFLPGRTYGVTLLFTCIGAAVTTGITYFIASFGRRGMTPQKLVLAGISISMLFSAFSSYLAIKYNIGQALSFWTAGGTASAKWNELLIVSPIFIIGTMGAIMLSPSITVMSLGKEVAAGLGLRTKLVNTLSTLIVLALTGMSVVIVGPISFVGLIIPHIVRYLIGVDYRFIIPACGLYGALFLVGADLFGRLINKPYETPLGVIFAVVGVPYFLYLARKQRREFE